MEDLPGLNERNQLLSRMAREGWHFEGVESSLLIRMNPATGKIEKILIGPEEIKRKYSLEGKEVRLEPGEDDNYYVFTK